ncbi:MAG: DUF4956 domain-containing protein [Clostridia bacterium]|nr:DUF4956 domain-containing protein [Clostridia bacterium]
MISFKDIIKGSILEQFSDNQLNIGRAMLSLLVAIALGCLIHYIYKKTFAGVVYSSTFSFSLILMTVITAVIIITISSNIVLSLGMVGALSIVRFRSAIKDPVDIMYLFWAISMGIVVGAQLYLFALISSLVIALICIIMHRLRASGNNYLLVVRCAPQYSEQIGSYINSLGAKIRNKTATAKCIETTAEIPENKIPQNLVESLSAKPGIINVVLVNYNGEYCE